MEILVVDDEVSALTTFVSEIVDEKQWTYKPLRDPMLALVWAKEHHVDAAFLDVVMPNIDGLELAKKLIGLNPCIKIVFISGHVQDESKFESELGENLAGFCYKPYTHEKLFGFFNVISSGDRVLATVSTFGDFDIKVRDTSVRFSCAKSKELLAFLIHNNGVFVTMDYTLDALFPSLRVDQAKRHYRNAVWRLRVTLEEYGLGSILLSARGQLAVNKKLIDCDAYRALDSNDLSAFNGEYMVSYEWSKTREATFCKRMKEQSAIVDSCISSVILEKEG